MLRHIAGALVRNKVPVRVVAGLANPEWPIAGLPPPSGGYAEP